MRYHFPSLSFADFYKDPDSVREFALKLEYHDKCGSHPGLRTNPLNHIDKNFADYSGRKILSLLGDFDHPEVRFTCSTSFQKIWRFSSDPNDVVNQGWIHHDGQVMIAAVVYLDPNPLTDNGTSFYDINEEEDFYETPKSKEYDGVMGEGDVSDIDDIKWFREHIVENNKMFKLTMEVKNRYNKAIVYSGQHMHTQTNYWMPTDDDFRLTQVFFFTDLKLPNHLIPEARITRYGGI